MSAKKPMKKAVALTHQPAIESRYVLGGRRKKATPQPKQKTAADILAEQCFGPPEEDSEDENFDIGKAIANAENNELEQVRKRMPVITREVWDKLQCDGRGDVVLNDKRGRQTGKMGSSSSSATSGTGAPNSNRNNGLPPQASVDDIFLRCSGSDASGSTRTANNNLNRLIAVELLGSANDESIVKHKGNAPLNRE